MFDYATINNLFSKCMFTKEELNNYEYAKNNYIIITGFTLKVLFNKEKLLNNKEEIVNLLNQIQNLDEGISILKAPYDELGQERTSIYACELLMCLGLGLGEIEYAYPRELWDNLPGGLPIIKRKQKEVELKLVK